MGKLHFFFLCVVNSKMLAKLHDGFEMPKIFREKIRAMLFLIVFTIKIKSRQIYASNFLVVNIFCCSDFKPSK